MKVLEAFMTSVFAEDLTLVKTFIDLGIDINIHARGHRLLTLAAASPDKNFFTGLLKLGADPNLPGLEGMTPLHMAVKAASSVSDPDVLIQRIRGLVRRGVDLDATDEIGRTPLDYAFRAQSVAVVKQLLKSGAQISRCFGQGSECWFHAVGASGEDLIKLALKAGVTARPPFLFDMTSMAENGLVKKVELLIRAGWPRTLLDGRDARKVAREKKAAIPDIWDLLAQYEKLVARIQGIVRTMPELKCDFLYGDMNGYYLKRSPCFCPWNTSLLVRVGQQAARKLIGQPGISEFEHKKKRQDEWIKIDPDQISTDTALQHWIEESVRYVRSQLKSS